MAKRNTKDRPAPPLVDSKGRPIYGTIPDGESPETIVNEIDYWRAQGFGFCLVKAFSRHPPLTVDGIRRSVVRHSEFRGRWQVWEEAAEKKSKAASGPRKLDEKKAIRDEVDRIQGARERRRPFSEGELLLNAELLKKFPRITKKRLRAAFLLSY